MALLDDLKNAASTALSQTAATAREQGALLKGDFEALVRPNLEDILVRIDGIVEDRVGGVIGEEQARVALENQYRRIKTIIVAAAELAAVAVQAIINAVVDALKSVVSAAFAAI